MNAMNTYRISVVIAAALVAFACAKLLAQVFLGNWQVLSGGDSDIAARGIFLLALMLPEIAIGSVLFSLGVVTTLTRRTAVSLGTRLVLAATGGLVGAGLVLFGADPTAVALRALPWSSGFAFHVVSALLSLILLCVGVLVALRAARASRLVSAAA